MGQSLSSLSVSDLAGNDYDLSQHRNKVVLIVNTASQCGLSGQYRELEQLWQKYRDKGLVVIGFPCNQFLNQEPGDAAEISEICQVNFGVTFPIMAKVDVNGAEAAPIFTWLKNQSDGFFGKAIKWNFTKFLIARDGTTVQRFAPSTKVEKLIPYIEQLLAEDA